MPEQFSRWWANDPHSGSHCVTPPHSQSNAMKFRGNRRENELFYLVALLAALMCALISRRRFRRWRDAKKFQSKSYGRSIGDTCERDEAYLQSYNTRFFAVTEKTLLNFLRQHLLHSTGVIDASWPRTYAEIIVDLYHTFSRFQLNICYHIAYEYVPVQLN